MEKIIALILSAMTFFSGISFLSPVEILDNAVSMFTGVPVSEKSIKDDFIDRLERKDVKLNRDGSGYFRNLLAVFLEEDTGVIEKYRLFRNNGLTLAGWGCPADVYIAVCPDKTLDELVSLGEKLKSENTCVAYAGPLVFNKTSPDKTPADPFDDNGEWTEACPSGGNWYLETIEYREALNYSEYFSHIKIGLVDSGFKTDHEELENIVSFPRKAEARKNRPDSHGTFVAGIVAAKHNDTGISGICPDSELICVDWEPEEDQHWSTGLRIFFGFLKVVKSGAKVVNMSLGTSSNIDPGNILDVTGNKGSGSIFSMAMSSLLAKGYDFVAVQSAGNGDADGNGMDAFYNGHFCAVNDDTVVSISPKVSAQDIKDRILVVGALGYSRINSYKLTSYSNFGDNVNITAPGNYFYGLDDEDDYSYMSGTSAAAPVVAAVTALAWSVNPSLTGAQVRNIIIENTKYTAVSEAEDFREYPVVNAKRAVEAALKTRYQLNRVTGLIDYSGEMPSDCVEITAGGNTKTITAPEGYIDLLFENNNGTINILGEYGNCTFPPVDFSCENGESEFLFITPVCPDTDG